VRAYAAGRPQENVSRAIWLSNGLDESYSAPLTARYLNATYSPVHIVWDPSTGTVIQMLSTAITAPYRAIPRAEREGSILIMATTPLTSRPLAGLDDIMTFIRGHGIPNIFPSGPPVGGQPIGTAAGHYAKCEVDIERLLRS
jgi:hypothetical protein